MKIGLSVLAACLLHDQQATKVSPIVCFQRAHRLLRLSSFDFRTFL